ncbi:MAG: hypothetical protein H6658_00205 [Ardenticatenaceae bacterium]|nr:hypothetical protein [Ardenticatenaceae bacterium]
MKMKPELDDELRSEYDMKQLLKGAIRGKYAQQYAEGTNLIVLAPDVAEAFPNSEAVHEALRLVMRLSQIPSARKQEASTS